MFNITNWNAFHETVEDLLSHEKVKGMHRFRHHYSVTCYEHSVFVSYVSFRLARRLGLDYVTAARGGLLHDLYLYNSKDKTQFDGVQCFTHPKVALENACSLCELSEKEKNIIISHMWPVSKKMPRSKEAFIVNLADKYCATMEVLHVWHRMKMRVHVPVPALAGS